MNKTLWLAISLVAAATVGVGLLALGRGPEWTTTSPEALSQLQQAEQAWMKHYLEDAVVHLERALELDPDFVIAKLNLLDCQKGMCSEKRERLLEEVLQADLELLTPRERFLVEHQRALSDNRPEEAERLLDTYLRRYPDDPYVLDRKASAALRSGNLTAAEEHWQHLVEVSPNWVLGYNQLGYLTMAQGRFAKAEEYFTSYRFIAPDQANPHDSLGELYLVRGLHDEAVESFERALQIKPEFWSSYHHLVLAHLLRGDLEAAREVVQRFAAGEGAPEDLVQHLECQVHYASLAASGTWQQVFEESSTYHCSKSLIEDAAFTHRHRAACKLGRFEEARQLEERAWQTLEKVTPAARRYLKPVSIHLEGVRLAFEGDLEQAASRLADADKYLDYGNSGIAAFKITNQLALILALADSGRQDEARRLRQLLHDVNPTRAEEIEKGGPTLDLLW